MTKMKIYTFEDLVFKPHTVIPGGTQANIEFPDGTNASVVGGPKGVYGNGVDTFELWYSDEDEPRGWVSKDEINREFASRSMKWNKMI